MALEGADVAEDVRSRHRQVERQLGGEVPVGQPAYAVGAEDASHGEPGQRLLYCGALRAFFRPYFLRSLARGVTGEEAGLLERGAVALRVDLVEGAGDRQAQRAGLAGHAAAVDAGDDVEPVLGAERRRTGR